MKCLDSMVWGIVIGMLFTSLLFVGVDKYGKPKPKSSVCEVSVGDMNHTHVRYGVVVGEVEE